MTARSRRRRSGLRFTGLAQPSRHGKLRRSAELELQVPSGVLTPEQKAAMIKGMTDVLLKAMKLVPDPTRLSFVQILETAEGGFGVNGHVFVPRGK